MGPALPRIDTAARGRLTARFGSAAEAWLDAAPDLLTTLAERWRLELGAAIPRGSVSLVLHCRTDTGAAAVLKASPDRARMAGEAAALRGWHGVHTPAVLAHDEGLGALLIEAIEPGTPLDLWSTQPAPALVAELLRALHEGAARDRPYPPLEQRVGALYDSSVKLYERHPELVTLIPPALYERGRTQALRLAGDAGPCVLLHGDLTPANILDGGPERGLVAIDPAPCLGDPAFDAVDLLLWRADDRPTFATRAAGLAAATGLDAERLLGWCAAFAAMTALERASQPAGSAAGIDALLELAAGV